MTEPHQVTPPVPPARPAAADTAAAEDLIGWVIQAQLLDEALLSPESARRVLAAALGVDEPALHAVAPTQLRTALSRLRRLVKLCDELEIGRASCRERARVSRAAAAMERTRPRT